MKIAITGSMGSGKSLVASIIRKYNYEVFDCDAMVDSFYKKDSPIYKELADIVKTTSDLKENIKKIFFIDIEIKKKVEEVVYKELLKKIGEFSSSQKEFAFVEVPLLYEIGWEKYFDYVVFVDCDLSLRKKRLKENRGYSESDIKERLKFQQNIEKNIDNADFIITNEGSKSALEKQVCKLLELLEEKYVRYK